MRGRANRRGGDSILLSFAVALAAAHFPCVQAGLPVVQFQTQTVVDRLSLTLSVPSLDGEQDYRDNVSGCCVMPATGELLAIMNRSQSFQKPPAIQVYDADGSYRRHISLTGFDDTEGMCQYDPDRDEFAIIEETLNEITIVTITSATTNIVKSSGRTIATGIPVGADGLEGVTYDRENGVFYVVQEIPMGVFRVVTNGGTVVSEELFDAGAVFDGICTDLSDLFFDSRSGHLFILSDEGNILMECELDGTILATRSIPATQPEGITFSDAGTDVHICGEPNEYYRYELTDPAGEAAEGSTVELPVVLSASPTGAVSVGYTISSDTALPGQDFGLPASGTLTFDPGCLCATVTVDVLSDTEVESIDVLRVALTHAVHADLGADRLFNLSIVNGTAAAPMLADVPFDCEVTPDATPDFSFWSRDPDGTAGMAYEVRWSTDPGFMTGVTVRSSAADPGFENVADGSDSSPFTEGEWVRFTVQPGDAWPDTPPDTVTYWQVRAGDAAAESGSGNFGAWSRPRSLAVDSGLALPQWRQAVGEQFAENAMDGTQVGTSNSIQLGTATIGFDNAGSGRAQPGDTVVIQDFTVADMPNRLLVLGLSLPDGVSVSSAMFDGVPLTQLDFVQQGSKIGAHLWYLTDPPVTTAQIVVSLSAENAAVAGASCWYNVDQAAPFGAVAKATGKGRSASVAVSGTPDTVVIDIMALRASKNLLAADGQTRRWLNSSFVWGLPAKAASGGFSSRPGTSAPVTMAWSWNDTRDRDWTLIGVPLRRAAGSVGTVTSPPIDLDWLPSVVEWDAMTFTDDETAGGIVYDVQYWDGNDWRDTTITSRGESPIDISGLDPVKHSRIRLEATLTRGGGTPYLYDWSVSWAPAPSGRIISADVGRDGLRLHWLSVTGQHYAVYCSTNLSEPWPPLPLTNGILGDTSGTNGITLPVTPSPCAFYRIELESE